MIKNGLHLALLIVVISFSKSANASQTGDINGVFINPSAHIGYSFGGGFYYGFQLSLNLTDSNSDIVGLSVGIRKYDDAPNFSRYVDFQHSKVGIVGYGVGANFEKTNGSYEMSHVRVKAWAGMGALITTDVMIPVDTNQDFKVSFGAVATLPVPVGD